MSNVPGTHCAFEVVAEWSLRTSRRSWTFIFCRYVELTNFGRLLPRLEPEPKKRAQILAGTYDFLNCKEMRVIREVYGVTLRSISINLGLWHHGSRKVEMTCQYRSFILQLFGNEVLTLLERSTAESDCHTYSPVPLIQRLQRPKAQATTTMEGRKRRVEKKRWAQATRGGKGNPGRVATQHSRKRRTRRSRRKERMNTRRALEAGSDAASWLADSSTNWGQ